MKKIMSFACVALLYITSGYAQSLEMYDGRTLKKIENGATVIFGDPEPKNDNIEAPIYIKNVNPNEDPVKLKVKRNQIEMVPGASESFCVMQCYNESVNENPDSDTPTILYGVTYGGIENGLRVGFHGIYGCDNQRSTSTVQYTFSVLNNPSDAVSVYIVYSYEYRMGIKNALLDNTNIYCENGKLHLDYDLSAFASENPIVNIYNVFGTKMGSKQLKDLQGNETIDVAYLPKGIYICSFVSGQGKPVSAKFIIK